MPNRWRNSGGKILKNFRLINGQRVLYQCHALLYKRTAREAYEKMLAFSQIMAANLNKTKIVTPQTET